MQVISRIFVCIPREFSGKKSFMFPVIFSCDRAINLCGIVIAEGMKSGYLFYMLSEFSLPCGDNRHLYLVFIVILKNAMRK